MRLTPTCNGLPGWDESQMQITPDMFANNFLVPHWYYCEAILALWELNITCIDWLLLIRFHIWLVQNVTTVCTVCYRKFVSDIQPGFWIVDIMAKITCFPGKCKNFLSPFMYLNVYSGSLDNGPLNCLNSGFIFNSILMNNYMYNVIVFSGGHDATRHSTAHQHPSSTCRCDFYRFNK